MSALKIEELQLEEKDEGQEAEVTENGSGDPAISKSKKKRNRKKNKAGGKSLIPTISKYYRIEHHNSA